MFDDRIGDMQKMLARMGPAGRQKYAADNANDPIAVSMALFVNNIAKELTEGKAADPTVQAPVVQQAIQAMNQPRMPPSMPQAMPQRMPPQGMPQRMPPPQGQTRMAADGGYMDSRLPEDMGIGALPERSLSGMADGGIVGYAERGLVQPRKTNVGPYEAQIRAEALRQKVNPDLMVRMFSTESSGNPNAVSPKGATGVGQLMPDAAKEMGLTLKERFDPNKNIPASVGYFKKQLAAFGGDPEKAAAAYNWGPGNLEKHLVKNQKDQKDWKIGLPKETANYLTELMPVGTAQAQTAPSAAAPAETAAARNALTTQIPGEQRVAPAKTSKDTSDKSFSQFTGNQQVIGAGEAALGLGTGLADYFGSAAKGLLTGITGGDAQKAANESMGSATYDPRTEAGRVALENSQKFLTDTLKLPPYIARIGAGTPYPTARFVKPATAAVEPAAAAPVAAAASVAPPVRTVPTPAQKASANTAQPVPQGLARVNQAAQLRREAAAQAAQEAAAAKGPQLPPLIGPPKPAATGIATLAPEAAALRTAAEARAKARAAERAAPAAAAAEEGAGAGAAAPRTGLAALPEAAGAAVAAEVPAVSRMAAARAAIGEGRGRAALLPAIAAAGAGTGSGASSSENATPFDRTSGDDTRGFPTFPAPAALTPEVKKEAVAEATKTIMAGPEPDRLKGLGYEDLLMFGLQLMAGKSQYALQNVGEAGVAALTANQARRLAEKKTTMEERKIASDEQKESAMAKYYEKHGNYLDSEAARKAAEDKPQMQYQKAVENAVAAAVADPMYKYATPAEQAQLVANARARVKQNFLSSYPELESTMGGGEFKVLGSRASP
jgi:soluble lytic murein transglycosylase-like protein